MYNISTKQLKTFLLMLLLLIPLSANANVTIDNGIVGDGFWSVNVLDAGDSRDGTIDPVGPIGPSDVIFALVTYYDNGLDGFDDALASNTTSPAVLSNPGEVTSSGTFPGPNGTVNWTAVSSIAAGSPIYKVDLTFSSQTPFGATRIVNYLDEDVFGTQNVAVVLGTDGGADFLLLTVDDVENIGVAHAAGYFTASNMTYAGWNVARCCGAPSVYTINPGQVTDVPAYVDPRFPDDPAYGIADITTSFAFDFDPEATTASVQFVLGGAADGKPPEEPAPTTPVPTLSGWALIMLAMLFGMFGFVRLQRRV